MDGNKQRAIRNQKKRDEKWESEREKRERGKRSAEWVYTTIRIDACAHTWMDREQKEGG